MFFNGLPEMPIRNVTVKNVVMTEATDGVVISQVDGVTLENIYVESTKGKNILVCQKRQESESRWRDL